MILKEYCRVKNVSFFPYALITTEFASLPPLPLQGIDNVPAPRGHAPERPAQLPTGRGKDTRPQRRGGTAGLRRRQSEPQRGSAAPPRSAVSRVQSE